MIVLTDFDLHSPLWQRIVEHYTQRLEQLRKDNDHDRDPAATARLRGRIEEVKAILRLGDPSPDREVVVDAGQ